MLVTVVAAVLLMSCGGSAGELKIYVSYSYWNQDDVRAYQLALREQSDIGLFKLKIVTLNADVKQIGRSTQATVERNARRAVADQRAIAYLGEGNSGPTLFSMPITNRGGLLQMCPSCTYVGLTRDQGALTGHPEKLYPIGARHFIRIAPADHLQAAALVEYLQQEEVNRVVIIHDGQAYGFGLASFVARAIPRAGIIAIRPPQRLRGDVRREARFAVDHGADAIMAFGEFGARLGQAVRRAAKAAPDLLIFTGDNNANVPFAAAVREVGHQFRLTGPALPDERATRTARFRERFTRTYGSAPSPNTYLAYEAMRRLIQAVRAAGERADRRSAIISAMFDAPEEDTLVGRYRFDKNGDSTLTRFAAYRIRDGKLSYQGVLGTRPDGLDP